MAEQICTYCGYEGQGKADPNRSEGGVGTIARIAGMLTMIPFYTIYKAARGKGGKICPNCGMPGMVKLNSDQGWITKRRLEVEAGLAEEKPQVAKPAEEAPPVQPETPRVERKKPVDPDQW